MVETVHKTSSHSVRQICDTLGFNRGFLLYYSPQSDPSEEELREKIEALALQYPKYGYRRIRALLLRQGYTIRCRRVARLIKAANLSIAVKRVSRQTTRALEGQGPWENHLQALDICRPDQVWAGDITYVRLKERFIYVAVLMDVFTRMIRGWYLSRHLTQTLTLKLLQEAGHRTPQRDIIPIKARSPFQVLISLLSGIMALRSRFLVAGVLGKTDTLKG